MDGKMNIPPWLRHVWLELTKPPAILHRDFAEHQADDEYDDEDEVEDAKKKRPITRNDAWRPIRSGAGIFRDFYESPTDPPVSRRGPGGSARSAASIARKYFTPRRTSRPPSSKPRPRKKKSISARRVKSGVHWRMNHVRSKRPREPMRSTVASTVTRPSLQSLANQTEGLRETQFSASSSRATTTESNQVVHSRLAPPIMELYDQKIALIEPVDTVWRITTRNGRALALKESRLPAERIRFIADTIDELQRRGFTYAARIVRTRDGQPFVTDNGKHYYASEWLLGRPVDFGSTGQTGAAARTLARLNESSRGYRPKGYKPPYALGVFEQMLARRQELAQIGRQLEGLQNPNVFDQLALAHLTRANQLADDALALMKLPEVEQHLKESVSQGGLCHLDVVPRNLLRHPAGYVQLIDLDSMAFGPRVLDLAHLIRRSMQTHGTWSSEIALAPLIGYNRIRPLSHGEYLLLESVLMFPHRFWRILQLHYEGPLARDEDLTKAVNRLQDAISLDAERENFLRTFARQVTRRKLP